MPPPRSTGPAAAASSSSTTRSRRSTRSPRPTTSAGSSSTAASPSRSPRPILDGDRPAWVGPPIAQFQADDAGTLTPTEADPDLAVYPVCTTPPTRAARRPRDPARGRALRARPSSASRWSSGSSSPPRSCSRSPRTPPTTWTSPATSSKAAASSRTRSGASRRRRWPSRGPPSRCGCRSRRSSPRSRCSLLGATFAAAQVSSIVVGALVPVLAWRLAADVAEERGLPTGRARTLAIGTGLVDRRLPAAPPPLRPARLDDAVHRPRAGGLPA